MIKNFNDTTYRLVIFSITYLDKVIEMAKFSLLPQYVITYSIKTPKCAPPTTATVVSLS